MPPLDDVGGDARGVDDHATLAVGVGLGLRDRLARDGQDSEGANEVDLDDLAVEREVVDTLATDDPGTGSDAGAVDDGTQGRRRVRRRPLDRGADLRLVGHVAGDVGEALDRCGTVDRLLEVETDDARSLVGERSSGGGPEPGGGAGDDGGGVGKLHGPHPASAGPSAAGRQGTPGS
jgi:hypothetical protein